jgi:hypothetical protein
MNEDRYIKIRSTTDYRIFRFVSEGRHGDLIKIVTFDEVENRPDTFNLALGTMQPDGEIDFITISNNGDRNKILATVARIVAIFIEQHPGKNVYITGSDNRRTLLYQRAIAYGYNDLIQMFNIYGNTSTDSPSGEFELFDRSRNYLGFLVERK